MAKHSFQEVIHQFDRMCWYYQRKRECPMGCPMNGVNISQCRKVAFEEPEVTEKTVMSWAAEHPEPVYPTWFEWLEKVGVAGSAYQQEPCFSGDKEIFLKTAAFTLKAFTTIPADIAEKLGLQPKEDNAE